MSKNPSISLRAQWLGERLRKARIAAGVTLQEMADQLQVADATVSRFESGTLRIRRLYVKEMIDFYGVSKPRERDALTHLAADAWRKDWWEGDTGDLEVGFLDYTWLESRAIGICQFSTLVPGLLQSRAYAKAVIGAWRPLEKSAGDTERLLDLRCSRQRILEDPKPVALSVVLEESAVRRPIGGTEVLRGQLEHLLLLAQRGSIEIQVREASAEWAPGLSCPFTLFALEDPYPEAAYVDNLAGQTFIEDEAKVEIFKLAYDGLKGSALTAPKSTRLIKSILKDLK